MFVAIEGIDGVGKSTVITALRKKLENDGYRVYTTLSQSITHWQVNKGLASQAKDKRGSFIDIRPSLHGR